MDCPQPPATEHPRHTPTQYACVVALAPHVFPGPIDFAAVAPGTMIVLLQPTGDGITALARALSDQTGLRTVTVVCTDAIARSVPPGTVMTRAQCLRRPAWAAIGRRLATHGLVQLAPVPRASADHANDAVRSRNVVAITRTALVAITGAATTALGTTPNAG